MPSIFISYRREDTAGQAGRLAEALSSRFGRGSVFMDIDTISPGADFERRINEALESCQLALIMIGQRWLTLRNLDGTRRIDSPGDFVKQEVAAALSRPDVTVVPVLVEGAEMPKAAELPPEIASLAKFNAFDLSNKRWQYDVAQLAQFARRYDKWWWRAVFRAPRIALRVAPLVVVAIAAIVAVALASGGGPSKAAEIAACERTHGMSAAEVTRPPRPGETQISRSDIPTASAPGGTFMQTTYASCSWPPPPGADPDGYRAITVTLTEGPGQDDASGRDFMDVIESHCVRLRLTYALEFMGVEKVLPPILAGPGDIWAPGASADLSRIAEIGSPTQQQLDLPYYPPPDSVVVLHGQEALQQATCLA